jgi:hypothetical protein
MRLNPPSRGFGVGAAQRRRGGRRGGNAPAPAIFAQLLGGEGLWAYQEGQMGQKMVCFEALRGTRSRQDESIEVGEVGSKRPSLGGNGGHVVRWIGLIFRLLRVCPPSEITHTPPPSLSPRLVRRRSAPRGLSVPRPKSLVSAARLVRRLSTTTWTAGVGLGCGRRPPS